MPWLKCPPVGAEGVVIRGYVVPGVTLDEVEMSRRRGWLNCSLGGSGNPLR